MEQQRNKRWIGLLVLFMAFLHLLADMSETFDFFGISPQTTIVFVLGVMLLVYFPRKSDLQKTL